MDRSPVDATDASRPGEASAAADAKLYAKVTWRLLPFIGLCYLIAYLDRVNVGFARLGMLEDLSLSETAYGFGAGVFFIGYFLFEVPSNLILHRVGARIWIARIMVTWGIVSGAMAFTEPLAQISGLDTATVFYLLRFLLGAAEAGFFPGILLYLNYWYPAHRQSRAVALLLAAQPLSFVLGAPVSGAIMAGFGDVGGMHDWQWLFLLEAAPALVLAGIVAVYLSNGIDDAAWLTNDEKSRLKQHIASDSATKREYGLRQLLGVRALWLFTAIYFLVVMGVYGINFWLPAIIAGTGVESALAIGWITALSYLVSTLAALAITRRAERRNEKRWHAAGAAAIGGAGLAASAAVDGTLLTVALVTLASSGALVTMALFWSFPGSILTGIGVAAGLAAINSVGNLGGFFGPYLLGSLTDLFGDTGGGIAVLGGCMIAAAALIAVACRQYGLRTVQVSNNGG